MAQYIEIDDELPELSGTSSPMPTLTSTPTSTSTSSSNRRETRRQTQLDSFMRPPVTMPSSCEEDEPVAQVPRSGRPSSSFRSPRQEELVDRVRLDGSAGAGIALHPRSTRLGAELRLRRRRLLCLWDTSDTTVWRGVECLSTIRDVSSHRHPTDGVPPTATSSGRGRMDRSGSADRHIPRSFRAERMRMNTDRAMSAIIP
jgi:hypothetical protein